MRRLIAGSAIVLLFTLAIVSLGIHSRASAAAGALGLPPYVEAATRGISPERIRAHVRFLSSDLLEGRGTGQRGGEIAAEYIATQFALAGLKPAGDNGTYLQKVPMAGVRTLPETTFQLAPQNGEIINLQWLDDFVTNNQSQTESAEIDAPIVFAGYGIEAPEYKWDDYKGADLRGKVLLMLVNEPPSEDEKFFKGKALTYYGRWTYKFEEAARRGAVAAMIIHRTDMASYGWNVVRSSWSTERSYLRLDNKPKLKAASWIQLEIARKLVGLAGLDLDQLMESAKSRAFHPLPLPVNLKAHIVSKLRPFESSNVLGVLPGAGSEATREAVMYTAHYDHLGIVHSAQGDNIYHGAVDNATGCGILLELARAYASLPSRPARSVVFAAVTGEEQGLLGSEFLGEHPPLPRSEMVLDLNFDAVAPIGDPEEVEVSGAERTTFYPVVEETARSFGLRIRPDAHPENGYYYRSDHFSLARVGIPSFSINEGMKFAGHTAEWGEEQSRDYTAHRYHQPSDEYSAGMDFAGVAKMARFGLALGWKAAAQRNVIAWQHGDEFEAARKKSEAAKE